MLIIEPYSSPGGPRPLTQRPTVPPQEVATETINIKPVGHGYGPEVRKHTVLGPRYMLLDRYLYQV